MKYEVFEDEHYYICHDGRELRHIRTETKEQAANSIKNTQVEQLKTKLFRTGKNL